MNQTPLKQTPRVVATGSLSHPKPQPPVRLMGPQLPTPRVSAAGTLRKPKSPWK